MSHKHPSRTDPRRLRYAILRTTEELSSIKEEWDRLWAETGAEYYLNSTAILLSWNEIHRPQGAELCCAVVYDDRDLVGVLPMILHRSTIFSTATTCGPGAAEGCDMLVKKSGESPAIATALLQNFIKLARPDYLHFQMVTLGSDLDSALPSLPARRILYTWDAIIPHADLKSEDGWTSYKDSLSKRFQANTARCLRRLNEQGKVTFDVVRGESDKLIDWIVLHKRRWSERTNKRGDWVFSEHYQKYLKALMSSGPGYILFVLRLGDTPVAASMVAINTRSATWITTTYDERYGRFSPGNILMENVMEHVFVHFRGEDGERLDFLFGPGTELAKMHWSRGRTVVARSHGMVLSVRGSARLFLMNALTVIRNRLFSRKARS